MNIEEMRARIDAAIAVAKSRGWTITPDIWVNAEKKTCCPLAAIWLERLPVQDADVSIETVEDFIAAELGANSRDKFVYGFDCPLSAGITPKSPGFALGQEYRSRYESGEL